MLVLGIESTCDETACSVVKDGKEILSNIIMSQQNVHRQYGGVYPEVSSRLHIEAIIPCIETALLEAKVTPKDIDLIAVAKGPGLIGSLLVGLNAAKALSMAWQIPFIGVNHVEAHLYAAMMGIENPPLPSLGVVVSGGHTFMLGIDKLGSYQLLGTTVDDAVGEAFDKVAKLLGLPYPGGPEIEKLAKLGNPQAFAFHAGTVKGRPYDFSFSGLKTSVMYKLQELSSGSSLSDALKADLAASFQETAIGTIIKKAVPCAQEIGAKAMFLGGGVCCNTTLREKLSAKSSVPVYFPEKILCLDNGAMIAGLGFHKFLAQGKKGDPLDLEPMARIPIA